MKKILIVMGTFFPGKRCGGPPVSIDNFCTLMKEYDCHIVTHDHDLFENKRFDNIHEGWNDRGNCKVLYLSNLEYNKKSFEKVIGEINPDILYLQGLFQSCVFPCLQLAKKNDIPVLLAPRGELCAGALSIKKWKKIPYIKIISVLGLVKKIYWQSTSNEESLAIKKFMKVKDENIFRLDNIPSIPKKDYSRRTKKSGEGRFVFLSRIHPKKNLLFAISLFKSIKDKVEFDIYGPIEDGNYWQQCQEEIKNLPKNVKVEYKGLIEHNQVHEVFSQYDAFLFPTLSENYGHVIAESLIVGTPVIISDRTPWKDIDQYKAGTALNLKEKTMFINYIEKIISMDDVYYTIIKASVKKYFVEKSKIISLHSKYLNVLQNIIKKKK